MLTGEKHDFTEELPQEILEIIFSYVPGKQLISSVCLVSKRWFYIIQDIKYWSRRMKQMNQDILFLIKTEYEDTREQNEILGCLRCLQLIGSYTTDYTDTEFDIDANEELKFHLMKQVYCHSKPDGLNNDYDDLCHNECWRINNNNLHNALVLLLFLQPLSVEIEYYFYGSGLQHLLLLQKRFASFNCKWLLYDQPHWRALKMTAPSDSFDPSYIASETSDDLLNMFRSLNCDVVSFRGSIHCMELLPTTLKELSLSIKSSDHVALSANKIIHLGSNLNKIKRISIHLPMGVDVTPLNGLSMMKPCGAGYISINLYLSDVGPDDVKWACKAAQKLQPMDGWMEFSQVIFPNSKLTYEAAYRLLLELKKEGVRIRSVIAVSSPHLNRSSEEDLNTTYQMLWGHSCWFAWYKDDSSLMRIWDW